MIKAKKDPTGANIYLRVSTKHQGIDGLSIKQQEEMARGKAAELGLEVVSVFKEVESGRSTSNRRPEFRKCMDDCIKHNRTLIVASMSRLTRNFNFMSHIADLSERHGIGIVACDVPQLSDPAQTKFIWRIMASVAEFEVERIRQTTREKLAKAKRDIKKKGYYETREKKVGDQIVPSRKITSLGNPNVADVSAKGGKSMKQSAKAFAIQNYPTIEEIQNAGISSLRGIAKALNARGIKTYQQQVAFEKGEQEPETAWGPETVKRVIAQARGVKK